jgi:hypothetical protein
MSARVLLLGGLLVGCGSSGTPTRVEGTIAGHTFSLADVLSGNTPIGLNITATQVDLVEHQGNFCESVGNGIVQGGNGYLVIDLVVRDLAANSATPPTAPGSFPVPLQLDQNGNSARVLYAQDKADCTEAFSYQAVSGSVTLTAVDGAGVTGSGYARFGSGDSVSFSFIAPRCAAIENPSSTPAVCAP